jgi:Pyruvate/2-oxoacid:ferredoxin oxidoreductase delta subunit
MKIPYTSLTIYFFSGTGNARAAANWTAERAEQQGVSVQVYNIDKLESGDIPAPEEGSLMGFFYPTHGFNAPPLVLDLLRRFPRSRDNDVFFVNTRAGMKLFRLHTPGLSGVAQLLPALMLRLKGFRTVGWRPLDPPSNWISIHPALRGKALDFIFDRCRKTMVAFTDKVLSGKKVYRGLFDLPVDLLISPIALLYFVFGRFILAKTFVASSDCDDCGLCVKQCPVNAIVKIKNRLFWSFSCESCMRCMNHCPKKAIETAHGATFLLWWIGFSILPLILTGALLHEHIHEAIGASPVVDSLFELVMMLTGLLFLFLAYFALHFLMKLRAFNKLVAWTSLTHLPFWGRYRAPKKHRSL